LDAGIAEVAFAVEEDYGARVVGGVKGGDGEVGGRFIVFFRFCGGEAEEGRGCG